VPGYPPKGVLFRLGGERCRRAAFGYSTVTGAAWPNARASTHATFNSAVQ
jgi:hypothetical protein